jgi:hypothetical protein
VIPVRVEDCPVEGLLAGIVYADLVGLSKAAAQDALLAAVRAALARRSKPLVEPDFPGVDTAPPTGSTASIATGPVSGSAVPADGGPATEVGADVDGVPGDGRDEAVRAASPGGMVARSDYLAQVRQIAPPQLRGRDAELAVMSAFCTDATAGSYVWWRAAGGPARRR